MTMLQTSAQSAERPVRTRSTRMGRARIERFLSTARDAVDQKLFRTNFLRMLDFWMERARTRRRLLTLDDRMLRDIGVSRADAWREGTKPFWK